MDLQSSNSGIDIAIDRVGIVGLEKKVEIVQENKRYSFYPKISALIALPAQQRGIHMSRTSETIEEVINEVKQHFGDKVYDTVIPRTIKLTEAPGFGQPIAKYDETSLGAKKYEEVKKIVC